jgi:hypothetical protein
MPMQTSRRVTAVILAAGALLLAAFAVAPSANAATLYACVKKNGNAHIYAKKPKCRKHETKLSWSTQGAAGLRGAQGLPGSAGATGPEGKVGPLGQTGPAGTARAYALMSTPGSDPCELLPAVTKNFSSCTRPETGVYCLTPAASVNPMTAPAFVTVEWGFSSGNSLAAFVEDTSAFGGIDVCGTGAYEVRTYNFKGEATDSVAFYILVP